MKYHSEVQDPVITNLGIKPNKNFRPLLTEELTPEIFKEYYWDKKELVEFCSKHKIPAVGGKLELASRIERFLESGKVDGVTIRKRKYEFDSEKVIFSSRKVINFKCDTKTREYFVREIGQHFKFNEYLRQFVKVTDLEVNLTYGDLVAGWLSHELEKKNAKHKPFISKQFQFNQFQRDFYNANKNARREAMLEAWKLVRSVAGQATYEHYLRLSKRDFGVIYDPRSS